MDSSLALGACDWLYGGVVWPVLHLRLRVTACLTVQCLAQTPGLFETRPRISLRIQTTLRYSLAMGSQVDRACVGEPGRRG